MYFGIIRVHFKPTHINPISYVDRITKYYDGMMTYDLYNDQSMNNIFGW